jgi:hypothetical protein
MEPVVIADNDVTFPNARRCRVTTHRTHATGDPLRTFFVRVLDAGNDRLADVTAVAEAEYYFVCGTDCVKPWSVPDRWDDTDGDGEYDGRPFDGLNGNGLYDQGEAFTDHNRNGQWDDGEPTIRSGPAISARRCRAQVELKIGNPQDVITPGFHAVCLPPLHSPFGGPSRARTSTGGTSGLLALRCLGRDSLAVERGMQEPTGGRPG